MAKVENVELMVINQENGGKFVDYYGRSANFTFADLQKMADNYDPAFHEAAGNIDHDVSGPAFGHVKSVRFTPEYATDGKEIIGGSFVANVIDDIPDDFYAELKAKRWTGRSVEVDPVIYPNLQGRGPYLKGFAWLGAKAPAVKGLKPISLAGTDEKGEYITVKLHEEAEPMNIIQWLLSIGKKAGDKFFVKVVEDPDSKEPKLALSEPDKTEVDRKTAPSADDKTKDTPSPETVELSAKLSEVEADNKRLKEQNALHEKQFAEIHRLQQHAEVDKLCETLLAEGRTAPQELDAGGLREHLYFLRETAATVKLADGKETTRYEQFVETLKKRPKVYGHLMKEFAPPSTEERTVELSEAEVSVGAMVGVTEDELRAYKGGGKPTGKDNDKGGEDD
jgi:hypothetical protein